MNIDFVKLSIADTLSVFNTLQILGPRGETGAQGPEGSTGPSGANGDPAPLLETRIIGKPSVVTTNDVWSQLYFILPTPSDISGFFTKARIAVAADQIVTFSVYTNNGDGSLTQTASKSFTVTAGVNSIDDVDLPIAVGQHVGFWCSIAPHFTLGSGEQIWFSYNKIETSSPYTLSSLVSLEFGATIEAAVLGGLGSVSHRVDKIEPIVGTVSADKFVEAIGSANPSVYQLISWQAGTAYQIEVIAKKAERSKLNLYSGVYNAFDCTFDLAAGTANGVGASIEDIGAGWYRCMIAATASSSGSTNIQLRIFPSNGGHPYIGDGNSGLFVDETCVRVGSGPNLLNSGSLFAAADWNKQDISVMPDVELFGGIIQKVLAGYAPAKPWQGKKWAALGTSITAQNKYVPPLASRLGLTVTNLGFAGGCIGANGSSGSLKIYNEITNIPPGTDLITIEAGINDFATGLTPLGSLGDTSNTTFYGALWAAVVAIHNAHPAASIVFFTPYAGTFANHTPFSINANGDKLLDFQKAVEEVAMLTGYRVIDVGRQSGIGYFTSGDFTFDGLHLNDAGGQIYADYVVTELLR